ncbi:lipoprotein [Alishewanella sp. 16-MA]|uniref:Lipoprotein n=1 Tax=Alishewanella maricola TaxID=2795740 RepID=A0ABS8C4W6_9ALTE|nr:MULTISPECIES: lipoprotein [Alishewanella]MDP4945302.1 lipoprotein [Alishewanella sp.]MDP5205962.1 lipoprotein [Alishewanella sp. SMS9]MCB5227372.1 lipoprotein [Alishewanella maricola]MDP5035142.1 lipoprotein [Alishewanella sp.]MDP5186416.1 lipoprotein [Alishewanella sp.]
MYAQRISRPLRLLFSGLLCAALLTACGQKGPLTLPQAEPEVAEPASQKISTQSEEQG